MSTVKRLPPQKPNNISQRAWKAQRAAFAVRDAERKLYLTRETEPAAREERLRLRLAELSCADRWTYEWALAWIAFRDVRHLLDDPRETLAFGGANAVTELSHAFATNRLRAIRNGRALTDDEQSYGEINRLDDRFRRIDVMRLWPALEARRRGRPAGWDWEAARERLFEELDEKGDIHEVDQMLGWQTESDLIVRVQGFLRTADAEPSSSQTRVHIKRWLLKWRSGK